MKPNVDRLESVTHALPPGQAISSSAMEALSQALRIGALGDETIAGARVRSAVRQICADARRQRYTPERLLIDLKECLQTLPEICQLPRGSERDVVIARVVTICIDEFFRRTTPP